jgi:hypothetical protein
MSGVSAATDGRGPGPSGVPTLAGTSGTTPASQPAAILACGPRGDARQPGPGHRSGARHPARATGGGIPGLSAQLEGRAGSSGRQLSGTTGRDLRAWLLLASLPEMPAGTAAIQPRVLAAQVRPQPRTRRAQAPGARGPRLDRPRGMGVRHPGSTVGDRGHHRDRPIGPCPRRTTTAAHGGGEAHRPRPASLATRSAATKWSAYLTSGG